MYISPHPQESALPVQTRLTTWHAALRHRAGQLLEISCQNLAQPSSSFSPACFSFSFTALLSGQRRNSFARKSVIRT